MRGWLIVGVLYLAATLWMATPFIPLDQLGSLSFAGDGRLIVWTIAWTTHALQEGLPLFAANMFFPAQNALAYTEHMLGLSVLALPFRLITDNHVLTFSLLWLLAFWANAMAAHLLAFRYTQRHDAAIAAGLVFGWSFFRMSHAGHLQLQWTAWLPLSLWLFDRWHASPTWGRLASATTVSLLQMLTSWYLAVLTALMNGGWIVWLFAVRRIPPRRQDVLQLGAAAFVVMVVLFPLARPYAETLGPAPGAAARELAADLWSYVGPPEDTWIGKRLDQELGIDLRWIWGEQTLFLGFIACALALVGAAVAIGRAVRARGSERPDAVQPLFFIMLAVIGFWLSLGPSPWIAPFNVLNALPGLALFRAPARFGLLVMLAVGVLSALGLAWCWSRLELRLRRGTQIVRALATLTVVLMLSEWRVVSDVGRASAAPVPAIYHTLNGLPRGAVMSLPDYFLGTEHYFRADYLLYSTAHWRPIVNGFGRSEPPYYLSIVERLSAFPAASAAELARTLGVRYFVIHTERLRSTLSAEAARSSKDFRLVAAIGSDYLFEVTE